MSNLPCTLTKNITSHSMENLAFHSLLRWKMIILPILPTSLTHFLFKRLGECTFWAHEWMRVQPECGIFCPISSPESHSSMLKTFIFTDNFFVICVWADVWSALTQRSSPREITLFQRSGVKFLSFSDDDDSDEKADKEEKPPPRPMLPRVAKADASCWTQEPEYEK